MNQPTFQSQFNRYQKYSLGVRKFYKAPSTQAMITIVLSLILVIVFLLFAIKPTIVKIVELKKNIESSETVLRQLQTKTKTLSEISDKWETISQSIPFLEASMPTGPKYRSLTKELEYLAQKNETVISGLTVGEALIYSQLVDPYKVSTKMEMIELPITIRAGGTYNQLMNLTRDIMQIDRLIDIEFLSLTIEAGKSREIVYPLSLNIVGKTYYAADPKQLEPILTSTKKDKSR